MPKPKSSPLFPVVEYVPAEVLQFSDKPTLTPIPEWVAPKVKESALDQFNPTVAAVFDDMPKSQVVENLKVPIGDASDATLSQPLEAPRGVRIIGGGVF